MINDGIININKPSGITSHDVVSKLRRRLHIKRIGHTGTLDPMATGVLPICIGKATRIIEYYDADIKSYHATMQLGTITDTLDSTGEVLETKSFTDITEELVREVASHFDGTVTQVPPKFSALKVGGKRLYEYAREGLDVEIKSREVHLEGMNITSMDLETGIIEFDISCSKGTYIRTIIDDIGRELGCGAMMTALVRTKSGTFKIEDAVNLGKLIEMTDEEIEDLIIKPEDTLASLGSIELSTHRVKAYCNGMSTHRAGYRIVSDDKLLPFYKVYSGGIFLGTATIDPNLELIPEKVMHNAGN